LIGPDLRFGLKFVSAILNLCLLSSIQNIQINRSQSDRYKHKKY
jgi:hypothetical protein